MKLNLVGILFVIISTAHTIFSLVPESHAFSGLNEPDSAFYLGGIQVNEPDQTKWISGLKTSGMNTVSVTVYAWQGVWDSDDIKFYEYVDETKVEEIREAKAKGLKVI